MWLVSGAIAAAFLFLMASFFKNKGYAVKWYAWLTGIIAMILVLFTAQNYFGSIAEFWPVAARWFLLISGLPALILLVLTWQLIVRTKQPAK
ncbi:reductive dehalogenase membrane anchor [Dehalogenimonas formicexedens]|uniref:Reductive dehalogenase membrane anchor n=1 Tax=Dehalogenimonas formicexedens TaxID=1839801 RepID=A0A1P8F5B6_9CHLR|nr:dehalogenase [Dehalogenimonas formicexedens]APV43686.1 reductive dehalogenase membrane anchor [Dehalogenimonas formicexedens]